MSIDFTELKTSIATVINTLTNEKVIWSNQNAPTPSGDYISMNISSLRYIGGTDYHSKPDINELRDTQGDREILLSLVCVSTNAMGILTELLNQLNLHNNQSLLCTNKLIYIINETDPIDITTEINNSFETRAVIDLRFRISKNYSSDTQESVPIVNSIGIEGEIRGEQVGDSFDINVIIQ